jgi:prepilin-type N-terminal cleavage/methylation domain-containing protein
MDTTVISRVRQSDQAQQGFTLLEAMISIAVLTIGLLAVLSVFAVAVSSVNSVQLDQIARQRATETLESIFTARQTAQLSFAAIQNTPNGIFSPGMVPLTDAGPDGLDGTGDDVPPTPITVPGSSGVLDGVHDVTISLAGFQRQIQILNIASEPNVRQVIVTVQYPGNRGNMRSYTVQALISSFR